MEAIDQQITLWINSFHYEWLQPFWLFMSAKKVWIPLYLAIIVLMIWRFGWKKGLAYICTVLIAFGISDQLCDFFKHIALRPRPCINEFMLANGLFKHWNDISPSFPSAHAFNTFAFVSSTVYLFRKDKTHRWKALNAAIICWAFIVALSRIMLGEHYAGDVSVGAILGTIIGLTVGLLGYKATERIKG